jgi:lysozyme
MTKNEKYVLGLLGTALIIYMLRKRIATALNKTPFGAISDKIFNTISSFEGFYQVPYYDFTGYSVGYGSQYNWDAKRPVIKTDIIDKETAKKWLINDAMEDYKVVQSIVKVPVTDNQLIALSSLSYNIGIGAFRDSTLLKLLNAGAYKEAVANEFNRWVFAGGQKSEGLKKRRQAEKQLFLS